MHGRPASMRRCVRRRGHLGRKRSRFGDSMSVYAFGPFILDPAERRLTRDGRRVAVPGKAWQILLMLAEAGGRLVSHETLPGEAVAQRRGRGPHAHRPYVDPAQGAGRRLGPTSSRRCRAQAIAWPRRCASSRRPVGRRQARRRSPSRQDVAVRPFATGRPRRGRQLSRRRHRRRGDHGAGRRAWPHRGAGRGRGEPGRRPRRSAWSICWRARCSAAPSGCTSRHA